MDESTREHACVVGLGWGDEGKGKVVDLLGRHFDAVIRYNGGANAGHTVRIGEETFALHLIPSGILHERATAVIGPGVVVDPVAMLAEIDELTTRGIAVGENLKVSDRAHLVMPYHKLEDQLSEQAAAADRRIGTTARGIGPCYADKMHRNTAVRACDLLCLDRLRERLQAIVRTRQQMFRAVFGDDGGLDFDPVWSELTAAAERVRPFVCDTTELLHRAMADGQRLLFEGANGTLLDINHGTFPFVTSSTTGPAGVAAGAGVPPSTVKHVVGVVKAYATRVGAGPFVSELNDAVGDRIREHGHEYGTTTGRPRRCGWFDAVATAYSVRLGGVTEVAMMHLDTLTGFDRVGVCVRYEHQGQPVHAMPADADVLTQTDPVYEYLPGWPAELGSITRFEDLPPEAARYVQRVEELIGAPVTMLGVGPERAQTIVRNSAKILSA